MSRRIDRSHEHIQNKANRSIQDGIEKQDVDKYFQLKRSSVTNCCHYFTLIFNKLKLVQL